MLIWSFGGKGEGKYGHSGVKESVNMVIQEESRVLIWSFRNRKEY